MKKIAILVDGGFYKKRAKTLFGEKDPEDRANELINYCFRHIKEKHSNSESSNNELYRIFYYDCHPSEKNVFHPLTQKTVYLKNQPTYTWNKNFFNALMQKRKVALRMGEILESGIGYQLTDKATKKLCRKKSRHPKF